MVKKSIWILGSFLGIGIWVLYFLVIRPKQYEVLESLVHRKDALKQQISKLERDLEHKEALEEYVEVLSLESKSFESTFPVMQSSAATLRQLYDLFKETSSEGVIVEKVSEEALSQSFYIEFINSYDKVQKQLKSLKMQRHFNTIDKLTLEKQDQADDLWTCTLTLTYYFREADQADAKAKRDTVYPIDLQMPKEDALVRPLKDALFYISIDSNQRAKVSSPLESTDQAIELEVIGEGYCKVYLEDLAYSIKLENGKEHIKEVFEGAYGSPYIQVYLEDHRDLERFKLEIIYKRQEPMEIYVAGSGKEKLEVISEAEERIRINDGWAP